jgi:glucosamine kinase
MVRDADRLIVAVDGGGSTCRACIAKLDGNVLGRAIGKPANITTDFPGSRKNILDTITMAYDDAGLSNERSGMDYTYLGLAGATVGGVAVKLRDSLNFYRTHVGGDLETTVQGALGDGDGTVAMLGTGSCFATRQGGGFRRVGGWGFRLCDDGGGAYLGQALLRLTVQAYDGLVQHSALTEGILGRYGGTPDQLVTFAQSASPLEFGSFAPELVSAFNNGDENAALLISRAVDRLEKTLDNLGALSVGPLFLLGGLGPFYQDQLRADYRKICEKPAGDPLFGAIRLAQLELIGQGQ